MQIEPAAVLAVISEQATAIAKLEREKAELERALEQAVAATSSSD